MKTITLVMHDWGAGLGFYYAHRHEANIKGLAFMEAIYRPLQWADFPMDFKLGFKLMRTPLLGWLMVSVMNVFVKQILPRATLRDLNTEEKRRYAAPFTTIASRRPVRQWPCEIPIDGRPTDVQVVVDAYHLWLQDTELPKLLCHASPGGLITANDVDWCQAHLHNITSVDLGKGIHYLPEDHPHAIGEAVAKWYTKL